MTQVDSREILLKIYHVHVGVEVLRMPKFKHNNWNSKGRFSMQQEIKELEIKLMGKIKFKIYMFDNFRNVIRAYVTSYTSSHTYV